ncbi:tetratricopeptide repeat protein [Streptomyces sp. NPDC012510]|uniref:tetratricopeptide repeat protein n=1 Tax=Streptomyces sp. NPDC012510 TaxID=3364838 RepID=UPI0036E84EFB
MSRFSRGEKKRQRIQPGAGEASTPGLKPIEVHVSVDGQATVGGMPVVAGPGESVQGAVLNYLHRLVLATGYAVAATVHDERIGFRTPLQVMADGSSRFTGEPKRLAAGATAATRPPTVGPVGSTAEQGVGPRQSVDAQATVAPQEQREQDTNGTTRLLRVAPGTAAPSAGPAHEVAPAPTPVDGEHVSAGAQASVLTSGPASEAVPELTPADAPPAPPAATAVPATASPVSAPAPEVPLTPHAAPSPAADHAVAPSLLAEPVLRINEALQMGRIETAAAMAEQTIASATKTLGKEHPEVLQLRELAAYIAYLAGDAQRSFTASMDLAKIRMRRRDTRAYANVQSAAAAWRAVRDPSLGLALGRELMTLWSELVNEGGPASVDAHQLEAARARMDRLAERARVFADDPYARKPYGH